MAGTHWCMGLLERWDRRNQRTFEWHTHVQDEERTASRDPWRFPWKGLVAGWLWTGVLIAVLDQFIGFAWTMGILSGLVVALFSVFFVTQRRKRRAWEASRRRTAPEG